MTYAHPAQSRPAWRRRGLGAIRYALTAIFAASGLAKLVHAPPMLLIFAEMGGGYVFAQIVGVTELAGAAMLLVSATALWGAWLLALLGAVIWDRSTP